MSTDPKDGSDLNPDNIIAVTLENLPEDEWQKLEQELEEERVEKLKQKLAGFQRTRNGVIQKVATPSHPAGVSKTACTEEIAHLIDASVASKYGKQMTDMARTITESVVSKIDEFKEQFNKDIQISLPRQIRSMVLQANDERYEKQPVRPENSRFTNVPNPMHTPVAVPNVVQPHILLSNNQSG